MLTGLVLLMITQGAETTHFEIAATEWCDGYAIDLPAGWVRNKGGRAFLNPNGGILTIDVESPNLEDAGGFEQFLETISEAKKLATNAERERPGVRQKFWLYSEGGYQGTISTIDYPGEGKGHEEKIGPILANEFGPRSEDQST